MSTKRQKSLKVVNVTNVYVYLYSILVHALDRPVYCRSTGNNVRITVLSFLITKARVSTCQVYIITCRAIQLIGLLVTEIAKQILGSDLNS